MKKQVLEYISNNSHIGIKAGTERPDFLDIWMVVVDDRIFARSWGLAERSWYNSFLLDSTGQINCGGNIFSIRATIPSDIKAITEKINLAYLTKYNSGKQVKYALGIVEAKHIDRTMEFIVTEQ